jgi:hypothetical protein
MTWVVVVVAADARSEATEPFTSLVDALLYSLDLADALGRMEPDIDGRQVHIIRDGGVLELSVTVIPGGLASEDA